MGLGETSCCPGNWDLDSGHRAMGKDGAGGADLGLDPGEWPEFWAHLSRCVEKVLEVQTGACRVRGLLPGLGAGGVRSDHAALPGPALPAATPASLGSSP